MSESRGRRTAKQNIEEYSGRGPRSKQDREEFIPVVHDLIAMGLNDTQIANQVGIDRGMVAKYRKQGSGEAKLSPIGRVQRGVEDDRVNLEIMRLYQEGLNYLEIAQEVGLSHTTIRARLRKQFNKALESKREEVVGAAIADLEVFKMELRDMIFADIADYDISELQEDLADGDWQAVIKKVQDKATKTQDVKLKSIEVYLKLLERETKYYGHDANKGVDVNVRHSIDPESIELMNVLKKRELSDTIEAEVIEFDATMGE